MRRTVIIIIGAAVTLAGCAPRGWVRPNTSQSETAQARYTCLRQAAAMFPAAIVQTGASNEPPKGQMVGNIYVPPSPTQYLAAAAAPKSYDANSNMRDEMFKECMKSQGYQYRKLQQP